MVPSGTKVITRLRERRQIDAALRRLPNAASDIELRRQVQAIARHGPQVLPSLIHGLGRADPRALAALGLVAAQLDRNEAVDAFFRVLQQPGHGLQARSAAVAILERHLGVHVPDDLRPGVAETAQALEAWLGGILDRAAADPSVLAAAVQELDQQEPDAVLSLVARLRAMPGVRPLELLRMLAQDVRGEIAAEAVQALGSLRIPEAAWALQTLIPASSAPLRPLAERLLRKQQFAGVAVEPLPDPSPAFRALAGPVDGEGRRQLWLIEHGAGSVVKQVLILVLGDTVGVLDAVEYREVPAASLPERQPPGTWPSKVPGRGELNLAEVAFDLGRRLVAEALAQNRVTQIPLPGLLRLLAGWLWGARLAGFPTALALDPAAADATLGAQSDRLARHLAFSEWHLAREAAAAAAGEALRRPAWDREIWVRRLAAELVAEPEDARRLASRLRANAEWLALAGQGSEAATALAVAEAVAAWEAQRLPFLLALVRRDLDAAVEWMESTGRSRRPGRKKGEA